MKLFVMPQMHRGQTMGDLPASRRCSLYQGTSTNVPGRPEISSMRNIPSFVIYYLFTHEILLMNSQMNSLMNSQMNSILYNHFVKI